MKYIITGKTFDNSDYKKEVKDIVELWVTLKELSLDSEIRDDRVLSSTIEVETVVKEIVVGDDKKLIETLYKTNNATLNLIKEGLSYKDDNFPILIKEIDKQLNFNNTVNSL